jgi:hypothetical protein
MSLPNMKDVEGKARYQRVRAGFILQDTSLNQWCQENRTNIQNVRDAFLGRWQGPKATELRERVALASRADHR